ncbi:MAG: lipid A export permease/ATP-binding protein MsbA [Gammaproteobacteria bacterium]|jgi:subfamily B ATP-binding cassette protein MsbA
MKDHHSQETRRIYARLLRYSLPHWKVFVLSVVAMSVFAATNTGFAALMKPMIDGSFVAKDPTVIRLVPLLIIGLFLVRGVTNFISSYCMSWVGREVILELRRSMFAKLLCLPTRFYDKSASAELLSKLIYDVEQVNQAATNALANVVKDGLSIVGLLIWMAYINWVLTVVFIVAGPPIAYLMASVNKRFRRISGRIQNSMADVTAVSEEAITGHRVVKIFGGESYEAQRFEHINNTNRKLNMKMVAVSAASVGSIELIAATALAGIIYLATLPSVLESVTVGSFMSFVVAMMLLMPSIKRLMTVMPMVQRGVAAAESIFFLLDQDEEPDRGKKNIARSGGKVTFRNVTFTYDTGKGEVLHDINLAINPGQCVALVGRSGSGKSTLVSLLPRFYEVGGGGIFLDDYDIRDLSLANLREQIAWVGQDVVLFNDTISHNIAYGALGDVSEAEIMRAAEAAHAMEFIAKLPEGLNTTVGENGVLLSGGQRQRLAIARALLKNAPVLILDEATSALDTESERHIQAALTEVMRHRTTLVIAHRLSTIENADQIVVLDHGRIVEHGRHGELLARNGHYAGLYRMQFHDTDTTGNDTPSSPFAHHG